VTRVAERRTRQTDGAQANPPRRCCSIRGQNETLKTSSVCFAPGNVGGAHWGGIAFDPQRELAIIPVNTIAASVQLIPMNEIDTALVRSNSSRLGILYKWMHGTPYVLRRSMITGPNGIPCTPPPFGALVAINLATGTRAWSVPLGDAAQLKPELAVATGQPLGAPNLGGATLTASGLTFIGASMDNALRAFDTESGRLLWKHDLPGGARATPMTFQLSPSGRQFVVIAVGGNEDWGKGDYVVSFSLGK